MAHEITSTDSLLLVAKPAWHGLGLVVPETCTPRQAITVAGLDWGVESLPVFTEYMDEMNTKTTEELPFRANYRLNKDGTRAYLGMVSDSYQIIENWEVADFCEALGGEKVVHIETVGSLRGGKRIWFLLRGDAFEVGKGDEIFPYVLVSNGHDGGSPFRITPTSVRTVCSNTLHQSIPREDNGQLHQSAFVLKHTTNLMERVSQAKEALKHYNTSLETFKKTAAELANIQINTQQLTEFFMQSYAEDFGEIANNPQDKKQERHKARAMDAFSSFTKRFDDEKEIANASRWCALNAYSGLIQHDKKSKGSNDESRVEKKVESNLFGLNIKRTMAAFGRMVKMVN
jgi:phage/plasmid-like protein (TIGR03299 family)